MQIHRVAKLFPPMTEDQFRELKNNIAMVGLLVPIMTYQGAIIDGVHRYRACQELGIEPKTQEWNGTGSLVQLVISLNRHRRHLTPDQLAAVASESAEWLAQEARERQREAGKVTGCANKNPVNNQAGMLEAGLPQASAEAKDEKQRAPQTRDQAAQIFQVSSRKVQDAISLKKKNPDLLEKVKSGEVTLAQATRVIKREEKLEQLSSRAAQVANSHGWKIYTGDCVFGLWSLSDGYAHLLFADPPYNCGVNYGLGAKADLLPKQEYLSWCKQWMTEAYRVCHPCGQFWVLISDEWADHFGIMLTEVGFHRRQWLIWYESFGVNQSQGFNRCSRHLFWMVKNPSVFTFNESAVLRPSDRSAKYRDKRAQPGGKTWDSVWGINPPIPRLVENAKERIPLFPTQLPLALLEPIVLVGSNPGDRIIDLFTGSAALGEAAIKHHREYLGYECNPTYAVHARNRLEGIAVNK